MSVTPPKYELLSQEKTKELLKVFKGERTGWVQVGPKKYFFPYNYVYQGEGFYNFKARVDDTWVMSYPRSGTTWTQELVWLLSNNLDYDTAKKKYLAERFPFLEYSMFFHMDVTKELLELNAREPAKQQFILELTKPGYEVLSAMQSPRFIKSHFPLSLLPNLLDSGCKVVYVARNPKDMSVSWYYMNRAIKTQGYIGDFETFWDCFENGLTPWSPYWEHLKEAWAKKDHPNFLFIFYEELYNNFERTVRKIAKFLGKTYNDAQIEELSVHLNIKNFRNNPMVNSSELKELNIIEEGMFVRKGQSGAWKEMFSSQLEARANRWIEENLRQTDLKFPYFEHNLNNNPS